jgi:hypothetical protein
MIACTSCGQRFVVPAEQRSGPVPLPYREPQPKIWKLPNDEAENSFYISLLSVFIPIVASVPAVVIGLKGLRNCRDDEVGGKWLATAGVCIGLLTSLLGLSILQGIRHVVETSHLVTCG